MHLFPLRILSKKQMLRLERNDLPIDVKHLELLRTTKPLFAGHHWPDMTVIEDAWSGNASDARILQTPDDGVFTQNNIALF